MVYFWLTRKTDPKQRYGSDCLPLALVDDELRVALDEPFNPSTWLYAWHDSIGYALACNKDWAWIKGNLLPPGAPIFKVIDYLEENFDVANNWGSESVWAKSTTKQRKA